MNGTVLPTNTYTISNEEITFTEGNEKSVSDVITSIKHSRSNVAFSPTATGELTVEIDGVLQEPDTYTVSGNQIIFDTAPADGAQTSAFLHSEEAEYTFEITNEQIKKHFKFFNW